MTSRRNVILPLGHRSESRFGSCSNGEYDFKGGSYESQAITVYIILSPFKPRLALEWSV